MRRRRPDLGLEDDVRLDGCRQQSPRLASEGSLQPLKLLRNQSSGPASHHPPGHPTKQTVEQIDP